MPKKKGLPWNVGMRGGHNANIVFAYDGKNQYEDTGICVVYGIPNNQDLDKVAHRPEMKNAYLIAAAPALAKAWKRIPRGDREKILAKLPKWVGISIGNIK